MMYGQKNIKLESYFFPSFILRDFLFRVDY